MNMKSFLNTFFSRYTLLCSAIVGNHIETVYRSLLKLATSQSAHPTLLCHWPISTARCRSVRMLFGSTSVPQDTGRHGSKTRHTYGLNQGGHSGRASLYKVRCTRVRNRCCSIFHFLDSRCHQSSTPHIGLNPSSYGDTGLASRRQGGHKRHRSQMHNICRFLDSPRRSRSPF